MNISAKNQIFVLHFAGGNCYSLNFVARELASNTEVHCLELPGRGKRMGEPLILDFDEAVKDYFHQIKSKRNGMPYVIYGHSMGATLGLHVTYLLEEEGDRPISFVASGNAGPGAHREDKRLRYQMSQAEFKTELNSLGGIPQEVLDNTELFEFFEPIMRADFEVIEKEEDKRKEVRVSAPIVALMGNEEETVQDIDNWKKHTSSFFRKKIFEGNHFFINDFQKEVSKILTNTLYKVPL